MSANSSSNSSVHLPNCQEDRTTFVFTALYVVYIILLPLFVLVLYIGFQRWRKRDSATVTSHTDVFTFHMAFLELMGVVGHTFHCYSIYTHEVATLEMGTSLFSILLPGQTLFHLLTCVERYLAVVHPVTYLGLRQGGGVRIRNISIGFVWLFCFISASLRFFVIVLSIIQLVLLLIGLIMSLICSISVLSVLIRPGPGERGRNRERVDQSKQRALHTMMAIVAALLLRFLSILVSYSLYGSPLLHKCDVQLMLWSAYWFTVPSTLVLPLLFLQRVGKLPGCKR